MFYQVLLAVGGLGLLVQALLGFTHSDSDSGSGHDSAGHHGHEGHAWFLLLSPLRLFGFSLGMGGAGLVLQSVTKLSSLLIFLLTVLAGWAFYRLIIRPLMAFTLRFASKPAAMLSGAAGHEATADSRFDASGKGIVTLIVDGQLVRLLATLESDPQPVEAGEKLVVIAIDTRRNTAKVTKL